jgi:hypothetical protein
MTTSRFDEDRPPEPPRPPRGTRPGGRKRRADPDATVPEADFTSYYGRNVVKPAPWGAPIPAYLFLGGLAAGSGLLAAGGHATGRQKLRRRGRIAALAGAAVSGVTLAADLGRPERALNMMRVVKLTSPMSVGTWILTGFGTAAGAAVGTELARGVFSPDSVLGSLVRVADVVASAGTAFFAPPLAAYTAVLLADTASPTWHQAYPKLPFVFVSSALAAGSGLALVTTPPDETGPVRQAAVLAVGAELVADILMRRELGELARPLHEGRAGRLGTAARVLSVAGAAGSALLGGSRLGAAASGLALMAGSACTRFAVFEAGMESAKDPRYTVQPQRARAGQAAAEGRGVTQPGGSWPQPPGPPGPGPGATAGPGDLHQDGERAAGSA